MNSVKLTRQTPYLFFLALTLSYLAFSPGWISSMGYTAENMNASNQIISNLGNWLSLQLAQTPLTWPRHGVYEVIMEIPFLLISRLAFGASPEWADHILSLQPVLVTALLCTLIFVWVKQLTSSLVWSYALGMAAAFSTMLWPYAYIGLETTQSLFLLLSGYLALGPSKKRTWLKVLAFAVSCGLAVSLKSNGVFLVPAVVSLVFFYFQNDASDTQSIWPRRWGKVLMTLVVIGALYLINSHARSLAAAWSEGALRTFIGFGAGDPLKVAFNVLSLIASQNKGLVVYAPVVVLSLATLPQAFRIDRRIVIFAGLTLVGLLGGTSMVFFWADETWGPRYLHSSIGPLIIALACARASRRFQFLREIPFVVLAISGFAISFVGSFFYYGALHGASLEGSRSTYEALQHDPNFNHIAFNLSLMKLWVQGSKSSEQTKERWPPESHWWGGRPSDAPSLKTVELQAYAIPQPLLVRLWAGPRSRPDQVLWHLQLVSLLPGVLLLMLIGYLVFREEMAHPSLPNHADKPGPLA